MTTKILKETCSSMTLGFEKNLDTHVLPFDKGKSPKFDIGDNPEMID